MEFATEITGEIYKDEYVKNVGYSSHVCNEECAELCIQRFHSKSNVRQISKKVTELLMGVDKNNRPIIVPDKTIKSLMSSVYENFRPETGDIHSRYDMLGYGPQNYVQNMMDQVINIITTDVKNNIGMEEANSKLSVWTTVLGDFNEHGLRSHSTIKIRENRPMPMMFNMNY
jgi:hypothetical protein